MAASVFARVEPRAPKVAPGSPMAIAGATGPLPGPGGVSTGSAFRRAVEAQEEHAPARVVKLPVSAWAPDYPKACREEVAVGLRIYAEAEAVQARAYAAQQAWRLHPQPEDEEERVLAGNGMLMAWLVARCATSPNDRRVRFFGSAQGGAEDVVPIALTPGGIEFLYGELEGVVAAECPTAPEADDEDLAWVVGALQGGALERLGAVEARRARRLFAAAISWMRGDDDGG